MIGPGDDRGAPLSPQLALRVAIVGGVALVLFAVVFFRLWVLQVLTGSQYVSQAQGNTSRKLEVAAPRGEILDSEGAVLVKSVAVPSIQISGPDLPVPITDTKADLSMPPAADQRVYDQLSRLLGMSTKRQPCQYKLWVGPKQDDEYARLSPVACLVAQGIATAPFAKVTIKSGVSPDIRAYIAERQAGTSAFAGVDYAQVYERQYPFGALASQVLGFDGAMTQQEWTDKDFPGVSDEDVVGQSGLEYQYNQYLQGSDGYDVAKVDASGNFEGWEPGQTATAGDNLQLSINEQLQKVGEQSLAESISKNGGAGGAFVAMDPENGQIYAMGSNPTYNPSIFTRPISNREAAQLYGSNSNSPTLNRAIAGGGLDGSTFKVITATAALESGVWGTDEVYNDTDNFCFPDTTPPQCLHNSGHSTYGATNLTKAIQDSVDTFFYNLGYKLNADPVEHPNGGALQTWSRRYGIGEKTGVDLPGESAGSLPTPKLMKTLYKEEIQCETATGPYKGHPKHPGGCGIATTPDWTVGDNVNTAVGQGDVYVTPMQLAVVYAAIANGGTVVTPHVGMDVQTADGSIVDKIDPGAKRHLTINPTYLSTIQQGLYDAAHAGTSADVMGNFGKPVYGKTGTAQYVNSGVESDYSWYACYVPASATGKPIVVVAWVPKGGFGDVAAAPVARQILNQWFYGNPGQFKSGSSSDL